jgi:nucleoside-diphosphate-sugar epimerase
MKIFLTGATGFTGSYLSLELVERGQRVTILACNIEMERKQR